MEGRVGRKIVVLMLISMERIEVCAWVLVGYLNTQKTVTDGEGGRP